MRVKMGPEVTLMMGLMMGSTVTGYSSGSWRDDECYREVGRGLRLEASHVDKYVKAGSLRDCERSCDIAFFACKSFSYSDYHIREPENCLLSREDTYTLDIDDHRDFYEDRDFIYYERTSGKDCRYEADHNSHSGTGCYELVKTRERINSRYVIRGKVLRTRDRQECEAECDRERECRGFNYRFKTLGYNQYRDNCELSSRDSNDRYDFETDEDFDFYEQVSDTRNCRGSSNSNYNWGSGGSSGSNWGGSGSSGSNWGGSGSSGSNWGGSGSSGSNWGSNTYGSRDECFRLAMTATTMESRVIRDRLEVHDIRECELECTRSRHFTCRSFAFRYGQDYSYGRERQNCFLTDREYRDMSNYDLKEDRSFDFYERRLYDRECGGDSGGYEDAGDMTVSGTQCYQQRCQEDRQGGYFFCETDFSGAWDYCCRPREICGFSEGYDTKWCYVGIEGRDQWRPCTGQGPGREYLKEEHPDLVDYIPGPSMENATDVQVLDLNDIA